MQKYFLYIISMRKNYWLIISPFILLVTAILLLTLSETSNAQDFKYLDKYPPPDPEADTESSVMGNFVDAAVLDIWKSDTLLRRILKQNKNNTLECKDVELDDERDRCDGCKFCELRTDSVYIYYLEKNREAGENGKIRGTLYARIKARNIPMFDGMVKIGMTWEEFIIVAETNIEYKESEYINGSLEEEGDVLFYFTERILQEVIFW